MTSRLIIGVSSIMGDDAKLGGKTCRRRARPATRLLVPLSAVTCSQRPLDELPASDKRFGRWQCSEC
jgi:hypothetical protein